MTEASNVFKLPPDPNRRKFARTYSIGAEWKNNRGQVYVYQPDHPFARNDGFVPRSRLVMEALIGRFMTKDERVYHENGLLEDDSPENLTLFASQAELVQYRAAQYYEAKTEEDKMRLSGWTLQARHEREQLLAKQQQRREKAIAAHAKRKARIEAEKKFAEDERIRLALERERNKAKNPAQSQPGTKPTNKKAGSR